MKQEDTSILDKIGKDQGFKLPENYFDNFNKQMANALPEKTFTARKSKDAIWVKWRPYVYMAATLVGILFMMHVFNQLNGTADREQQIQTIVAGFQNDTNIDNLMLQGGISDYDILCYEDSVAAGEEFPL